MLEKIKVLIVDDESTARLALRGVLEEHFPQVHIQAEVKNVPEAVKEIHQNEPDLVFLDIEMPGYSGLELLDFFPNGKMNAKIVFVTAYQDFALRAFEMAAVDYILKPVDQKQIQRALGRISPLNGEYLEVLKANLNAGIPNKLSLPTKTGLDIINIDEILYLKADGSYTHLLMIDGSKLTASKRLSEFQKLLSKGDFMRVHRSHMVNLQHITRIGKDSGDYLIMKNGDELVIAGEKRLRLLEYFEKGRI
jgi:two-component system LytT family response regulator